MISVVIPTLNAEKHLASCLSFLMPAAIDGLVKEVIIVDGGSGDQTRKIAEESGARFVEAPCGRGTQLAEGARLARGEWLLFLHADTRLEPSWLDEARALISNVERVGVFTLKFDTQDLGAKIVSTVAMLRTKIFALPYGDQGLLISRTLYEELGGYHHSLLFEDVDFIDRLKKKNGRRTLHIFKSAAITSPEHYERHGYIRRVVDNFWRLIRYKAGVPPEKLAKGYWS